MVLQQKEQNSYGGNLGGIHSAPVRTEGREGVILLQSISAVLISGLPGENAVAIMRTDDSTATFCWDLEDMCWWERRKQRWSAELCAGPVHSS